MPLFRRAAHPRVLMLLLLTLCAWAHAWAAQVETFSPQGSVKGVRQIAVRFSEAMVMARAGSGTTIDPSRRPSTETRAGSSANIGIRSDRTMSPQTRGYARHRAGRGWETRLASLRECASRHPPVPVQVSAM